MCREILIKIYLSYIADAAEPLDPVEKYLGINTRKDSFPKFFEGEEREAYMRLFSEDCKGILSGLYAHLEERVQGLTYEKSTGLLAAFSFLQWVLATGLWKFKAKLPSNLEKFARDFDRLDIDTERTRLYESLCAGP